MCSTCCAFPSTEHLTAHLLSLTAASGALCNSPLEAALSSDAQQAKPSLSPASYLLRRQRCCSSYGDHLLHFPRRQWATKKPQLKQRLSHNAARVSIPHNSKRVSAPHNSTRVLLSHNAARVFLPACNSVIFLSILASMVQ